MKNEIKISVIVLVYNLEKYIREALDSLVNQTIFNDLEIICINNGSTDSSLSILNEYKNKYKNIQIVNLKENNPGLGTIRQIGLDLAKGKYIAYLDGDDYIDRTIYEKLYKKIEEEKSDVVSSDCFLVKEEGLFYNESLDRDVIGEIDLEKRKKLILKSGQIWNKLFKREIIKKYNIKFIENYTYEDNYFIPYYLMFCKKISQVQEPLYYYRMTNQNSITRKKDNYRFFDRLITSKKLYVDLTRIDNERYNNKLKEEIEYKFVELFFINTLYGILRFTHYPWKYKKEIDRDMKKYKINYKKNKYFIERIAKYKFFEKIIFYLILKFNFLAFILYKLKK